MGHESSSDHERTQSGRQRQPHDDGRMIERVGVGQVRITCDECEWDGSHGFVSFQEATAWMRENGWVSRKEDGDWWNYCPECAEALGLKKPFPGVAPERHKISPNTVAIRKSDGSLTYCEVEPTNFEKTPPFQKRNVASRDANSESM